MTENRDKYFIETKEPGCKHALFSLSFDPGNLESAVNTYNEWTRKLITHDWPILFAKDRQDVRPMDKGIIQHEQHLDENISFNHEQGIGQDVCLTDYNLNASTRDGSVNPGLYPDGSVNPCLHLNGSVNPDLHLNGSVNPGLLDTRVVQTDVPDKSNTNVQNSPLDLVNTPKSLENKTIVIGPCEQVSNQNESNSKLSTNQESLDTPENQRRQSNQDTPENQRGQSNQDTSENQRGQSNQETTTKPVEMESQPDIPTALDQVVYIAPSSLPGAGKGLFAKIKIPKWTYLGFYFGLAKTEDEFDMLKEHLGVASQYVVHFFKLASLSQYYFRCY